MTSADGGEPVARRGESCWLRVVVLARTLEGSAATSALQPGEAIHAVNGAPVSSVDELRGAVKERGRKEPLVLQIERAGRFKYLTFDLE